MPLERACMPARKWDSTLILQTIRRYKREGKDISYNEMARSHQGLVSAANYYFGSYRKAVIAAGIDYDKIRRKPNWTTNKIIQVLRQAHRKKLPLNWYSVSKRRDLLGWAGRAAIRKRAFGDWNKALSAAGIDPDSIRLYHRWSNDEILRALRARRRRKQALNTMALQEEMPGLYAAAVRHFGSYEVALQQAGIDPEDVKQRRQWNRESICRHLREFEENFGLVSQSLLRKYDSGLMRAVRIQYGNLHSAIEAAGVTNYSIRGKRSSTEKTKKRRKAAAVSRVP